jgi:catechol-2,3-dioxygenase
MTVMLSQVRQIMAFLKAVIYMTRMGNVIELYWDRLKEDWPLDAEGNLMMFTKPFDYQSLLSELKESR